MGWGRMDDGFDDHPKVVALLDHEDQMLAAAAIGLWTLCWAWAHRNTRKKGKVPGLIQPGLPRRYIGAAASPAVDLLVKHGLWDPHESGGWLIHDFSDYLPSDETREARSEAGKRGAAARWGNRASAGNAGKIPAPDGNLPSTSHDGYGNETASDASRAPARRDPTPTPTPTPTTEPPSDVLFRDVAPEPVKPKQRLARTATRIPEDFTVTPAMVAWAVENAPLVNGKRETEQFMDHWRSATRDAQKKDWVAAWRKWMRNAQERAERYPANVGYRGGYPDRNAVAVRDAQPRQSAGERKYLAAQAVRAELDAELAQGSAR